MSNVTEIAVAPDPASESGEKGDRVALVVAAVRRHIRDEGLRAGATLPGETVFAERCGVSRVVVREAFRSLSALGVIDVGNGRRARVGSIDSAMLATVIDHAVHVEQMTILQIYDVRRTLEARTARLAALRATPAQATPDRRARRGDATRLRRRAGRHDPRHRVPRRRRRGVEQPRLRAHRRRVRDRHAAHLAGRLEKPRRTTPSA